MPPKNDFFLPSLRVGKSEISCLPLPLCLRGLQLSFLSYRDPIASTAATFLPSTPSSRRHCPISTTLCLHDHCIDDSTSTTLLPRSSLSTALSLSVYLCRPPCLYRLPAFTILLPRRPTSTTMLPRPFSSIALPPPTVLPLRPSCIDPACPDGLPPTTPPPLRLSCIVPYLAKTAYFHLPSCSGPSW